MAVYEICNRYFKMRRKGSGEREVIGSESTCSVKCVDVNVTNLRGARAKNCELELRNLGFDRLEMPESSRAAP